MRNLRRDPLCRFPFFLSLLVAVAVAGMVPAARTQVLDRVNSSAPASEKQAASTSSRNTSAPAQAVAHARENASTAALPQWTAPIFLAPAAYLTSQPNAVAVADVNGDGKPDIVAVSGQALISVLLGNGDGTFRDAVNYPSGGELPTSIVVADMNGDGKPDILVANESYGVDMLLGNGDGTFQPAQGVVGVSTPRQLLVADINHDGKADLVVLSGSIGVLLGNGNGTFQPLVDYSECIGCFPSSFTMTDVNGDGKLDLLVAYWNLNSIGMRLGNGDGTFQSETLLSSGGEHPSSIAAADVNGDSHIDLVLTNNCLDTCGGGRTVTVLLGNGDGTFQPPATYGWDGYSANSVAIADINGDGKLDLVIGGTSCQCGPGTSGLGLMLGKGDGTFQATLQYSPNSAVGDRVLVADLNGDKRLDVVSIPSSTNGWLQVWLHVGAIHTTTALNSSLNPSVFGQAMSVTANVGASSGTPTGTVELFDKSFGCFDSFDCGGSTLTNRSAVFTNIPLVAGTHPLVAAYQGSLAFNSSTSNPLNQVVQMATTTSSVVSSLNPATPARKFIYTATVTGQYGGGTFGTVTFSDGAAALATVNLASGHATFATSNQSCGVHPITTTYSGDPNNDASTSLILNEYVQCSTSTLLTTSGSPTFAGQPVTFTAKVASRYGSIPDGEIVTFYDGKTALASIPLAGQTAAYTTSSLSATSHPIAASYAGDAHFTASTGRLAQKVVKYPTTTTVLSSLNPSQHGQPVTFTARVISSGGPKPTGKVAFRNGLASLGTAVLSGGAATLTISNLPVGTNSITVDYLGDVVSAVSKSAILSQVVH